MPQTKELIQVGWREWLALPELNIERIKAKIDTGARTSALHACDIEPFEENGQAMVRFRVHPRQRNDQQQVLCCCPVVDQRRVTDSGGHSELRYVIETMVQLGELCWPVEVTLSNRKRMKFRMLLGRTALQNVAVLPQRSYLFGRDSGLRQKRAGVEVDS